MVFSSVPMAVGRPPMHGVHSNYSVNMFRTCETCNPTIDATNDTRLSIVTRSVITSWISENLNGRSIDGPMFGIGETSHVPEHIAVRAYWLASDQSRYERETTCGALAVESVRVVIADQWTVEYSSGVR
jgi:hypothetical protein